MQSGLEAPTIDVTATQRQLGVLEASTQAQLISTRSVAGSADASFSFGARASRPSSGAQGDRYFADDIGARGGFLFLWNGVAWEIVVGWASGTDAQRSAYTPDTTDSGAFFWTSDTCKLWEIIGSTWTDRFVSLDAATSYEVGGTKVVGARGAAVADVASADATDLATAITLVNELKAQVNTGFARLRSTTGHGLWT